MAFAPTAHASDSPPPGSPTATFDGWTSGADNVTVSWQAVAGEDLYVVTYRPGDYNVDTIGSGFPFASASGGSTTVSGTLPVTTGDVTFLIQPNGSAGNGTPTTVILHIPGPTFTAVGVSGVVGQSTLTWLAGVDGDSLVLRRGTTDFPTSPTDGTAVVLGSAGTEALDGLGTSTAPLSMFEVESADPAVDYSPPIQVEASGAPAADQNPTFHLTDNPDPTQPGLSWSPPVGCTTSVVHVCDRSIVVVKAGTAGSINPSDGRLVGATSETDTTDTDALTLDGIAVGSTYTATVFNIAVYPGDQIVYSPPVSATWTNLLAPTMTFTTSPASGSALGQPVTLTASVSDAYVQPTGTVTISDELKTICGPVTLTASGIVTCHTTTQALANDVIKGDPGVVELNATYDGDSNLQSASFFGLSFDVTKALATVNLKAASTAKSKTVTMTIRVNGKDGFPTGTTTLTSKGHTLCRVHLRSGRATCRVAHAKVAKGTHHLIVTYSGDRHYRPRRTTDTVKVR